MGRKCPQFGGGTYDMANLRATHRACNTRRGDSMDAEFFPAPKDFGDPG